MLNFGPSLEEALSAWWFISCAVGGPVFIAIGARAAGLALLGALLGAFIGMMVVSSHFDQLPQGFMVGATVGTFLGGLAGLAWRPPAYSSASTLRVLGLVTILVGFLAAWAASQQACSGLRDKRCMPEVDGGSLALIVLDAVWVAALCFIQAAQSNRASSPTAGAHEFPELPAS